MSNQVAETKEQSCPTHGAYISIPIGSSKSGKFGMIWWTDCPKCDEDKKTVQREQDAAREKNEFAERLGRAGIPLRLLEKKLDDYQATTPGQVQALATARSYAANFDAHFKAGRCLIFAGFVGTGKTMLACGIIRELLAKPFRACRYATASGIIRSIRETWNDRQLSEAEAWRKFSSPHLLVIDEVGRQHGSDSERAILEELIDLRYQAMRPSLVISNCPRTQITQFLGERGYDRLLENGGLLAVFDWPSHRGQ